MERRPLRLLVLEPDARLAALLRSTLEPEGFDVTVAASIGQMASLTSALAAEVVLVDEVLASSDGATGLRTMLPVAATLILSGVSGGSSPEAARLMHKLGASAFLRKPYSLLDLPAVVRRHAPLPQEPHSRAPAPANGALTDWLSGAAVQAMAEAPAQQNARLLGRLWSRRSSGRLSLKLPGGGTTSAGLSVGGVDGAEAWELVQRALAGAGTLDFESGSGSGHGDWVGLGASLMAGISPKADLLSGHRLDALHRRCDPSAFEVLPLALALRQLIEAADVYTPLGVLERKLGIASGDVSDGLSRLLALGLVEFQQPIEGGHRSALAQPKAAHSAPVAPPPASVSPRPAERLDSDAPTLTGGRTTRSSVSPGSVSPGSVSPGSVSPGRGRPVPRDRSLDSTDSDISRASTSLRRGNSAVRAETLRRLQGEKSRLVGVSSWVVLSIPEHSPVDLIAQAASRMRRRYRHLAARTDLDPDCRQIAREIEALVDSAEKQLGRGVAGGDSLQGGGDSLLEIGKRMIQARDWVRADRALGRASEQSMSNPEVLASHGWARLNNPERPEAERREEGRDLLLLAEQLDPRCLVSQLYLARYFIMTGDTKRAQLRAERALRIAPADPEAQLLLQECRSLSL